MMKDIFVNPTLHGLSFHLRAYVACSFLGGGEGACGGGYHVLQQLTIKLPASSHGSAAFIFFYSLCEAEAEET